MDFVQSRLDTSELREALQMEFEARSLDKYCRSTVYK